jgi:hypothetical protein
VTLSILPTEDQALTALTTFLTAVIPDGCPVVQGQPNRVPEPNAANYVVITPRNRPRLSTDGVAYADAAFTGHIAGTAMTVTAVAYGELSAGRPVFGPNVAANTKIVSGLGGVGDYVVSPSQTAAAGPMAAGVVEVSQQTEFVVQIDAYGPIGGDVAQTITTMLRSLWGVDQFAAQEPNYGVVPLFASDPQQMPFSDDQQQVENRWMLEAYLQINPVVTVPQQFADALVVGLVDVDERFPAS